MKRLVLLLLCFQVFYAWAGPYDDFVVNGIGYKIISQSPNRVKVNNNVNNTWLDNWSDLSLYAGTVSVDYTGVAVIPDTVEFNGEKYLVAEIGVASFRNSNVTEIHLPSSVNRINYYAFQNCHRLRKVYFSEGLDTIALYAFQHCDSLEDILLPNSLLYVGGAAFFDCPSVKQLNIGTDLVYMAEDAFVLAHDLQRISYNARNCYTEYLGNHEHPRNIGFSNDSYCRLDIGDSVQRIPENLFYGNRGLRGKVIIPGSVRYIAEAAFYRTGIDTLVFVSGVDSLGESCFQNCDSIRMPVLLPNSLKKVSPYAFYGNYNYSSPIVLPENVAYIGDYAFFNVAMIGKITVPASVRYIGEESLPYDNDTLIIESDTILLGDGAIDFEGVVYINSMNPPRLTYRKTPVYVVDTVCPIPSMPDFCYEMNVISHYVESDRQLSIDEDGDLYIFIPCGAKDIYCQASPGWQALCEESADQEEDFYEDEGYYGYYEDEVWGFRILENGYRHEETIQVCDGYAWGTLGYLTQSNTYTQTFTAADGCDSIVTLHLNTLPALHNVEVETACNSYTWHGTEYTASGNYVYHYSNGGCASADTLHLTILHGTHNVTTETACESYTWHGQTYTQGGTHVHHYTNNDGCASADTLHLTIHPNPIVTITGNTSFCEGASSQLTASGGSAYQWSTGSTQSTITVNQTGNYVVTVTSTEGCSATSSIAVIANPLPQITITGNTTICAGGSTVLTASGASSYVWNTGGQTASLYVDAFGMYSVTGTSSEGCVGTASVVVLVNQPPAITIAGETEVCRPDSTVLVAQGGVSYIWNNGDTSAMVSVYAPGVYQVMGFDDAGCHSTASVTVHFWDADATEVTLSVPDSCYEWNGERYCQSGDYVQTLQNVHGCDSVVTLHLTITVGVNIYPETCSIKAYPNPTSRMVTIEVDNPTVELTTAVLYNAVGERLRQANWGGGGRHQMDMAELSAGVYFIRLYSHGNFIGFVKVVKQ